MKRILSIALIALLAVSTAFAGFTGNAKIELGYNLDDDTFGFTNSNGFDFSLDLATAEAEAIAEGEVYAGIKADFALKIGEKYVPKSDDGTSIWDENGADYGIGLFFNLDEAYVAGENWKVAITGVPGKSDFAKSAIDTYEEKIEDIFGNKHADDTEDKPYTYEVGYFKAPGVTAELFGYKAGFGLKGQGSDKLATSVFFATPEYALAEGFTLGAGVSYAYANGVADKDKFGTDKDVNSVGGSLKLAYENDVLAVKAATDIGYDILAEKFGADVAASFAISPVTVDAYYATTVQGKDNYLSAQVVTDLTAFSVPLKLTVTGKHLIEEQDLSAKVEFPIDAFTISVNGGYVIGTETWKVGGDVKYASDMFTAKAGAKVESKIGDEKVKLGLSASIETSTLIPGATLAFGWYDAEDILKKDADGKKELGKINASCKITF